MFDFLLHCIVPPIQIDIFTYIYHNKVKYQAKMVLYGERASGKTGSRERKISISGKLGTKRFILACAIDEEDISKALETSKL